MITQQKSIYLVFLLSFLGFGFSSYAMEPERVIKNNSQKMIKAINANKADLLENNQKLFALVDEILIPHIDFGRMSRLTLGKHWRRASKEERVEFTKEFHRLLVRTYATALIKYVDSEIDYKLPRYSKSKKSVLIKTELTNNGGPVIPLDYKLYKKGGKWLIYDVVIDDVSLVVNYRTLFAAKIRKKGGLSKLIQSMSDKNNASVDGSN